MNDILSIFRCVWDMMVVPVLNFQIKKGVSDYVTKRQLADVQHLYLSSNFSEWLYVWIKGFFEMGVDNEN